MVILIIICVIVFFIWNYSQSKTQQEKFESANVCVLWADDRFGYSHRIYVDFVNNIMEHTQNCFEYGSEMKSVFMSEVHRNSEGSWEFRQDRKSQLESIEYWRDKIDNCNKDELVEFNENLKTVKNNSWKPVNDVVKAIKIKEDLNDEIERAYIKYIRLCRE